MRNNYINTFTNSIPLCLFFVILLSFEVFNTYYPIFEVGKGLCVYHQLCCEILKAFFAHTYYVLFRKLFEIISTFKAKGILIFAEYNRLCTSNSHMFADNPDGNLPVFFACFFFGHDNLCVPDSSMIVEPASHLN